jgi:hypothetical protein
VPVSGGEPALAVVILRCPFPIRRKRPVRTRLRGAVGAGGEKPPATRLGSMLRPRLSRKVCLKTWRIVLLAVDYPIAREPTVVI